MAMPSSAAKRRDAQLTLVLGDGVVVLVEASVCVVCDRVGDLALGNGGHGTRSANARNLARHKAGVSLLLPAGNLGLDKRGAVVGLRAALGLQLNRALGDLVRALDLAAIVVMPLMVTVIFLPVALVRSAVLYSTV